MASVRAFGLLSRAERMERTEVTVNWDEIMGLGVAGNFAGHLEQAGEAADFRELKITDARAPKGVFPFFVPGSGDHFLHSQPLSSTTIRLAEGGEKHQIEPEVSLLCDVSYDPGEAGRVARVVVREARAHNDCSIRREGAKKISEKKNWGADTKGVAATAIAVDRFAAGGILDHFRLASFLLRDGELHDYGIDSALTSYSYFYAELIDWLVERLREQQDEGPLEDLPNWIEVAGRPAQMLISIGATRYTDYGETTFLARGDRSIVALYDTREFDLAAIRELVLSGRSVEAAGLSLLDQFVV
jgi:hypothetical protein